MWSNSFTLMLVERENTTDLFHYLVLARIATPHVRLDLMEDFTKVSKQNLLSFGRDSTCIYMYFSCHYRETPCYKLAQHPQNIIQEPPAADTAKHVRVSNTADIEVDGLQHQRLVPFLLVWIVWWFRIAIAIVIDCSCLHWINLPGCSSCWPAAYLKGSDSYTICKGPGLLWVGCPWRS